MVVVLTTPGFRSLPVELQQMMIRTAMAKISPRTDMIVFDPSVDPDAPIKETYEDEGRTLRIPVSGLEKKVYAKLDDFHSPEILSRELGHVVNTQYTLTLMLADEY